MFRETEESHYRLATELCRGCVLVAVDGASRRSTSLPLTKPPITPPTIPPSYAMSSLSPLRSLSLPSSSPVSLITFSLYFLPLHYLTPSETIPLLYVLNCWCILAVSTPPFPLIFHFCSYGSLESFPDHVHFLSSISRRRSHRNHSTNVNFRRLGSYLNSPFYLIEAVIIDNYRFDENHSSQVLISRIFVLVLLLGRFKNVWSMYI